MERRIFSADSHITEPGSLFRDALPERLQGYALISERGEGERLLRMGEKVLLRHAMADGTRRHGANDLTLRLADMEADGIDAELVFPSMALMLYHIPDWEAELASAQVYNDWAVRHFADHRDRFVPTGVLPVRKLDETVRELQRIADIGLTTAMLPVVTPDGVPKYNSSEWDPVFALAAKHAIPITLHTGTGLTDVVVLRGSGGAVFNYTRQINDAIDMICMLVGGGVLDRNPGAQIAVIEAGASWLAGLSERMDEVYRAHEFYVRPKLGAKPSEIVRRQVHASFQFDRAAIMSRQVTGHAALLWGSDYPHMEGTFPHSRNILGSLFDGIDISQAEQEDIVGGTAARLFRLQTGTPGLEDSTH